MEYIEVDGSFGEGGGQILRYSLALSSLTMKPVRVYNIRARRSNPGLRPQHLAAVKALAEVSGAEVKGAGVGSTEVFFKPRRRAHGRINIDVGTAGSASLVIQAVLPVLLYAPGWSILTVKGGTDVQWSPPIDYMSRVFAHNIKHLGVEADVKLVKRGHYPRGGGVVEVFVKPVREALKPVDLVKRGRPLKAVVVSHSVKLPRHVAERQASTASILVERVIGVK
ncbi:MAG: RNA 3'-terminal phosphate cyclase, partial [Thermosphaera sp.]